MYGAPMNGVEDEVGTMGERLGFTYFRQGL